MANALKLMKTRSSRLMQAVLELHGLGSCQEEADTLLACIQVAQRAQLEINQLINQHEAKKKGRPVTVITYPTGLKPPVYSKQTGITEALPRQPKTWAGREVEAAPLPKAERVVFKAVPVNTPEAIREARDFLHECEIEGDRASFYDCMSWNELSKTADWETMNVVAQAAAIRARSERMAIEDPDDPDELMDPAPKVAPQFSEGEGIVF